MFQLCAIQQIEYAQVITRIEQYTAHCYIDKINQTRKNSLRYCFIYFKYISIISQHYYSLVKSRDNIKIIFIYAICAYCAESEPFKRYFL